MREGSGRFTALLPHHSGAEAAGAAELRAQGRSTLLGDVRIQCPHILFSIVGNHYLLVV